MRALKTQILHCYVAAHQNFASRLLTWIHDTATISSGYRYAFYKVMTSNPPVSDTNYLETLMLADTKFWKSIRVQWHHLFISSLLKEYFMKKVFAAVSCNKTKII